MADARAPLERRYRRLLVAYPSDYRRVRGDEIVSTLIDLAGPDRRMPSPAEAVDLIAGGLRRRLRLGSIAGLDAGLRLAAPFALAIAAGISAYAWWRVEPVAGSVYASGPALFGMFRTLGPAAYAAWLLAALARSVLRPARGRLAIGSAIAVTVLVAVLTPLTTLDRPPLWVLMALIVFGALALAGTSVAISASSPTTDERLAVPAGAVAVAVAASAVILIWPPAGGGYGYYYQPTIARVGTVVAAGVATVALVAIGRLLRRLPAQEWLWATALLGLPAGWLGPFDTTNLRLAAEAEVPRFGRLAQVLLATCLAVITMAWLVRRSTSADAARPAGGALRWAGAATLGSFAGLGGIVGLGGLGWLGFAGAPLREDPGAVPGHVLATGAALALAGGLALVAVPVRPKRRIAGLSVLAAAAAAWCVGAYDNGWTASAWPDFGHTATLIATLGFVPLSACLAAAAGALIARRDVRRWAAAAVVIVSGGWLAYATLPYVFSWGPVLLVLLACAGVLAVTGRRSSPTA